MAVHTVMLTIEMAGELRLKTSQSPLSPSSTRRSFGQELSRSSSSTPPHR